MYKLFLCLRYLRSRVLAYFAMLGVGLCVAVMLICVSVMSGFLWKIERAAKGLFGDIVVESASLSGLGRYDELIEAIKAGVDRVEAASPFILTYGIIRVPGTDYRQTVQIAGIRLPQRADVSDFENGLFVQKDVPQPTFDPPMETVRERSAEDYNAALAICRREEARTAPPPAEATELAVRIRKTLRYRSRGLRRIDNTQSRAGDLAELRKALAGGRNSPGEDTTKALEKGLTLLRIAMEQSWADLGRETSRARRESKPLSKELERAEKSRATDETADALAECIGLLESFCVDPPARRIILGLGIPGFSFRTYKGETIRHVVPGNKVSLTLMPLGKRLSASDPTPNTEIFTVIDDCNSGVSSIDSKIVYVPFKMLQKLTNMGAEYDADRPDKVAVLPRTSQIHVKVTDGITDELQLREICGQIREVWAGLRRTGPVMASTDVSVVTWRQLQAKVVQPIEQQRILVVILVTLISFVGVVLIFVILYTIVVQKTRDIGVLKAVGASSGGVAGIFFGYGAIIGLIGSAIGILGGYCFVRNINAIQDWTDEWFNFRVWDREVFMFEKIPNEIDWSAAVWIVVGTIIAGLIGALVPAMRAARMQPVEALRYE